MRAGRLNDPVTVERRREVRDKYGNTTGVWEPLMRLRAEVRVQPAREALEQDIPSGVTRARVRFGSKVVTRDITAGDRLVFRGLTWNIESVPVSTGRRREDIEIICTTGVAT